MISKCFQKCPHGKNKSCGQFGFTLVELLLVCVILGVVATIAALNFSKVVSGGQIGITAREIMAAGRYARTMALLYQTPVDLVIRLDQEEFFVEARDRTEGNVMGIQGLDFTTNSISSAEEASSTGGFSRDYSSSYGSQGFGMAVSRSERDEQTSFRDDDDDDGRLTGVQIEMLDASGAPMQQDISATIKSAIDTDPQPIVGIKVRFEGYSDVVSSSSAYSGFSNSEGTVIDSGEIRIRYRANGTVRPYKLSLSDSEGNVQIIEVNSVGTGKSY